eukprot:6054592-Heterocapsa_arctica.AAC.2
MVRVLMKPYSKEAWNGRLERKRLDSVLKLEELGENENNKLDLDNKGYGRTCAGRLIVGNNRSLQCVSRVCHEHNVRGPNELAEAIQPYGMEEQRPLHVCVMSRALMNCQWSLRRMNTVGDGYGGEGCPYYVPGSGSW